MIRLLSVLALFLGVFFACEKEEIDPPTVVVPQPEPEPEPQPAPQPDTMHYDRVGGYVQKGPFLNGTALQITELDSSYAPTGKNYSTQLLDNRGTFEVRNVELVSPFVELKADGFYYNEVTGTNSSAQLTLYALANLEHSADLNVNLLSSLEKGRALHLLTQGNDLATAKAQARQEILKIFEMDTVGVSASEAMDISKPGVGNAKLLALSVILQGYLDVAGLSELVANISTDIRTDGRLDSRQLGSALMNNAVALDLPQVRKNLESRYEILGLDVSVPDFESAVEHFIQHSTYTFTNIIRYPERGEYGPNLLDTNLTVIEAGYYSLVADLPVPTDSVRVVISGPNWGYVWGTDTHWTDTDYDYTRAARTFKASGQVKTDLRVRLTTTDPWPGLERDVEHNPQPDSTGYVAEKRYPTDTTRILVYENGATEPVYEKKWVLNR